MTLDLQAVARAIGATGSPPPVQVSGWSVDTRTQQAGDVYFALRGESHDGHEFVGAAVEKGAAAVVVEEKAHTGMDPARGADDRFFSSAARQATQDDGLHPVLPGSEAKPRMAAGPEGAPRCATLVVADTLRALQSAGAWAREKWGGTVVGVTGSAGKTTTKDAIAHLLAAGMTVGKTVGNFNNHIGVPLSILRLPDGVKAGVIEIGMNHAGEIRELAAIAKPQIAVVTNVGYAHVEFFGSIEGVAAAKRELVEALPRDGVAVLNADDPRVLAFRDRHPGRSIAFGFSECAEVRGEAVDCGPDGARFRALGVDFETGLTGRHAVSNLLAAIAVARAFGIAPERLREPVRTFAAGKMRGERSEHDGIAVWNDCYNSNPEAAQSMIDVLRGTPAARRIAVLGEMLELGQAADELHRRVGRYAAENGVDLLIGVRGHARAMVEAAREAGGAAEFFEAPEAAGEFARAQARSGDAVLFKGSRGVRMERAMEKFLE
jgi:UDP-N-acetylmuramoyl-tripeptide--D-alanyl-D-alanine ligase